ncbi:hypothetical protein L1987_78351 [Smallanthus sonchifolius]|uniref:Uncharacterized protein n=1 Tax=Smallanthus sonchifolius TaxID=185202 RepID=A0ACB8ZDH5_9ASTR|nr:hypothetical protein L1987_78351 [Smallanthus sonchifolius]
MAEASRIFQTTLMPSLSQTLSLRKPSSQTISLQRTSPAIIRCTISTTSGDTSKAAAAPQPIPWGCEIDSLENAAALQKWLTDSGLPPQKMDIRKVDVGERGLVANNNIRKGEKLLFVPPSLVISADSVWSGVSQRLLKRDNVPDWPLIATYLIRKASLMESSRWSNYISALPRQPYSLLYWTRAELDRYLEASQIRERAIERINNVFISYGRKSNGELLLSYGFVPREGTNPRDSVELPLSIKKTNKCYAQKVEALNKHGLSA